MLGPTVSENGGGSLALSSNWRTGSIQATVVHRPPCRALGDAGASACHAVDQRTGLAGPGKVIPEDRLLVFNKDPREEYSDMVDWNDDMEASFERDLNRPFIHGLNMSEELGVVGIPHIFYIDANANIEFDRKGIWTNHDASMSRVWKWASFIA